MDSQSFHSGFACIIGPPNAGKSTLLNMLLSFPLNIVSNKPQTTRHSILGIWNNQSEKTQIIFTDTPGILKKEKSLLDKHMSSTINTVIKNNDFILFIIDASDSWINYKEFIENIASQKPIIIFFNKMDLVEDKSKWLSELECPYPYLPIIANSSEYEEPIIKIIKPYLTDNIEYYPDDILSNRTQRFFITEYIREALLTHLSEEIPHDIFVEVAEMKENSEKWDIEATLYCLKNSQKKIIIGQNGSMIKEIGIYARKKAEQLLEKKVNIKLYIQIEKKWKNSPYFLKKMEYY